MPNKIKVLCTVDQLTVDDLVHWLKGTAVSLLLLSIYFLALFVGTCLTPMSSIGRNDWLGAIIFDGCSVFTYLLTSLIIWWFSKNPLVERVIFCYIAVSALTVANLGATVLLFISDARTGSGAFFFCGFLSGCASIYIVSRMEQKMINATIEDDINEEHSDGHDISNNYQAKIDLESALERHTGNEGDDTVSPLAVIQSKLTGPFVCSTAITYSSDESKVIAHPS